MLLCPPMVQMKAGEPTIRDFPVLLLWISERRRAPAWIIGKEHAQSECLAAVQKKDIHVLGI